MSITPNLEGYGKPVVPVQFDAPVTGELAGSTSAVQGPTIACRMVKIKAAATNAGKVYIGFASGVTVKQGSTNTTTGWQLSPGESTDWIYVANLNLIYRICDNSGDASIYMAMV